jgi:hypothetical protein
MGPINMGPYSFLYFVYSLNHVLLTSAFAYALGGPAGTGHGGGLTTLSSKK